MVTKEQVEKAEAAWEAAWYAAAEAAFNAAAYAAYSADAAAICVKRYEKLTEQKDNE